MTSTYTCIHIFWLPCHWMNCARTTFLFEHWIPRSCLIKLMAPAVTFIFYLKSLQQSQELTIFFCVWFYLNLQLDSAPPIRKLSLSRLLVALLLSPTVLSWPSLIWLTDLTWFLTVFLNFTNLTSAFSCYMTGYSFASSTQDLRIGLSHWTFTSAHLKWPVLLLGENGSWDVSFSDGLHFSPSVAI